MPILVLLWIVFGLLVGLLAGGARLRPQSWGPRGRYIMFGLSVGGALLGGIIGTWLFGDFYSIAMALWTSVLVVAIGPWLILRFSQRNATPRP